MNKITKTAVSAIALATPFGIASTAEASPIEEDRRHNIVPEIVYNDEDMEKLALVGGILTAAVGGVAVTGALAAAHIRRSEQFKETNSNSSSI